MTTLQTYSKGTYTATAELIYLQDSYTTVWWVSSLVSGYLRVVGTISLPIHAESPALAVARLDGLATNVITFVENSWGGASIPAVRLTDISHAYAHMEAYEDHLSDFSDFDKTIAYYELLSGFRVSNPAVLIAKHMGVRSVRTVHDRIARARRDGYLETFGQGRAHA